MLLTKCKYSSTIRTSTPVQQPTMPLAPSTISVMPFDNASKRFCPKGQQASQHACYGQYSLGHDDVGFFGAVYAERGAVCRYSKTHFVVSWNALLRRQITLLELGVRGSWSRARTVAQSEWLRIRPLVLRRWPSLLHNGIATGFWALMMYYPGLLVPLHMTETTHGPLLAFAGLGLFFLLFPRTLLASYRIVEAIHASSREWSDLQMFFCPCWSSL